jgi:hypothetical protein
MAKGSLRPSDRRRADRDFLVSLAGFQGEPSALHRHVHDEGSQSDDVQPQLTAVRGGILPEPSDNTPGDIPALFHKSV